MIAGWLAIRYFSQKTVLAVAKSPLYCNAANSAIPPTIGIKRRDHSDHRQPQNSLFIGIHVRVVFVPGKSCRHTDQYGKQPILPIQSLQQAWLGIAFSQLHAFILVISVSIPGCVAGILRPAPCSCDWLTWQTVPCQFLPRATPCVP